jgi:hypothetical protein
MHHQLISITIESNQLPRLQLQTEPRIRAVGVYLALKSAIFVNGPACW